MTFLREASFAEFALWYMRRDWQKKHADDCPWDELSAAREMRIHHRGKVRPWYGSGRWRLGRIDSCDEFKRLVFMDSPETQEEGLVTPAEESNFRLLEQVAQNAVEMQYWLRAVDRSFCSYYHGLHSPWASLKGMHRLVICELDPFERKQNPRGSFYIQDGSARALALACHLLQQSLQFPTVEVFVATRS